MDRGCNLACTIADTSGTDHRAGVSTCRGRSTTTDSQGRRPGFGQDEDAAGVPLQQPGCVIDIATPLERRNVIGGLISDYRMAALAR